MVHHGLQRREALVAATARRRDALGLGDHVGTVEPGKIADLVVVDGDPLERVGVLRDRDAIWLVLQSGRRRRGVRWSGIRWVGRGWRWTRRSEGRATARGAVTRPPS